MKRIKLSLLIFIALSACVSSTQSALTPQQAIAYSQQLLQQKGLERDTHYAGASSHQVLFPDGRSGVFVALGCVEPPRGYQLLYQILDNQFELVSLKQTLGIVWGINSLRNPIGADIETSHIFASSAAQPRQTLKVTGAGYADSGLWRDGYFEIIEITNTEPQVLFTGVKFWTDQTTLDAYYQYKYHDPNSDGNVDFILETSDRCKYKIDNLTGARQDFGCLKLQARYQFDGTNFVEETPP